MAIHHHCRCIALHYIVQQQRYGCPWHLHDRLSLPTKTVQTLLEHFSVMALHMLLTVVHTRGGSTFHPGYASQPFALATSDLLYPPHTSPE